MKTTINRWLRSIVAGLALAGSAIPASAQTWENPMMFDVADRRGSWIMWNGWGMQEADGVILAQDPTLDAANNPEGGSLRYEIPFTGGTGEQIMSFGTLHDQWGWDNSTIINVVGQYKNLEMDFRLDPLTKPTTSGNFGTFTLGLVTSDWGQIKIGEYRPTDAGSWTHISLPIDQGLPNLEKVTGYYINLWSGGSFTNSLVFNVDNVYLAPSTNEPPPPPPTMTIQKPGVSGVQITMDNKDAQWQRDGFITPADAGPYLWASQGGYPVSYSFTLADFPDSAKNPGLEAHMYLVNGDTGASAQTSGSPDWDVPDLLIVRIENDAAGGVLAQIQWKTNYAAANATNIPAAVNGPTANGTWTLTFTDSTHGALTGPGNTATNFTLPEDAVLNNFSPAASFLHFGVFKNDGANDGHNNNAHGTFTRVQMTGPATSFDDDFSGATLTNKYEWRVSRASAVQHIPNGTAWMVDWTLPAGGFSAQSASNAAGPWIPATFTKTYTSGSKVYALVGNTAAPGQNAGFFRLIKRPFVKLQILLPGETAAPNTTSGKTGTPTPQTAGTAFNITVNAVDEFWNIVPSSDSVAITSSDDASGNVTLPAESTLIAGTKTFSVTVNSDGSYNFTATDTTDTTKTAGTSSNVQLNW